jgi:transcriptional repressor NrdR
MFCINCFHTNTSVSNSRPHKKQPVVWRRRTCAKCGTTFTTLERPSLADNTPVYRDGNQTTTFNLGRLIISIAAAFAHDPKQAKEASLWLAQTVENSLSTQISTITPEDIAAITHQTLKRFDELAAVQYAAQHQLISSTRRRAGRPSLRERGPSMPESPSR